MNKVTIENVRFTVVLSGGGDPVRIHGNVYGHPGFNDGDSCYPSVPISMNKEEKTFTTQNTIYHVGSFDELEEIFWGDLKDAIENKGYKVI